ncbi:hypothetical protein BH10BDE1_BH10BDE1_13440 [soil metagenome]
MKSDKAGTENLNQKQASQRVMSEAERQMNPSIKFDPRQESSETAAEDERTSHAETPHKTIEDAPAVDSTKGGL